MTTNTQNSYNQVYNAREDEKLLSWTDNITCILGRRWACSAAFNASNELLSIHYSGYNKNRVVWDINFFEQHFSQEPFLAKPEKIKKVFIHTNKSIIVPNELFDLKAATQWLQSIAYIEPEDKIYSFQLPDTKNHCVFTVPATIDGLIKIYCPHAQVMPLQAIHFGNTHEAGINVCYNSVLGDECMTSLYKGNQLLWNKTYDIAAAADVAFEVGLVCQEHKIAMGETHLVNNAISATDYNTCKELASFFAKNSAKKNNNIWAPAIELIKHTITCE